MITYAILIPERDAPIGYRVSELMPTLEELADHMAAAEGFADREEWAMTRGVGYLAFAPVH